MTRLRSKREPTTAPSPVTVDNQSRSRPTQKEFRPTPRRRARIAAGIALAALAVCANVLIYTSLNNQVEVIQIVESVQPGEQLEADDLRIVEADFDPTVQAMPATAVPTLIGQYSRTLLVAGMIMVPDLAQKEPIVKPGSKHISFSVPSDQVPYRTAVGSQIDLILDGDTEDESTVSARIVSIGGGRTGSPTGDGSAITVEVDAADTGPIAEAGSIRIALIPPTTAADTTTTDTSVTEPAAEPGENG